MSLTNKIKPCPFCGSGDVIVAPKRYHGGVVSMKGNKFWRVECLPCDARTGDCFDADAKLFGFKDGREMAIFGWNKRYTIKQRIKDKIVVSLMRKLDKLNKYLHKVDRNV